MPVTRAVGVALAGLLACTGGGSSGPDAAELDAAELDASLLDAPALDAPATDARPTDARDYDAFPIECSTVTPHAITTPRSEAPWLPAPLSTWAAAFSLDTPVPLSSLWFDVASHVSITVFASCSEPAIATGTTHRRQVDVAITDWTDGTATDLPAGRYLFDVRAFPSPSTVILDVRGVIADGAACTDPLVTAGVLACSARANCDAGVCAIAACSNGIDDDGDGLADDADPGCALANDRDEADPCGTGGPCPECADAIDSDGDGAAGWPADRGCDRRGDPVEHNCPDADGVIEATAAAVHLLTPAMTTDHPGPLHCGHTAADRVLHLRIPGDLSRLSLGLGQQAIGLTLYRDTCDTAPLECLPAVPGWPAMFVHDVPAGDYWLVATPFATTASLSITGTLVAGARCEPTTSAFACPSPESCLPAVGGGHRCQ